MNFKNKSKIAPVGLLAFGFLVLALVSLAFFSDGQDGGKDGDLRLSASNNSESDISVGSNRVGDATTHTTVSAVQTELAPGVESELQLEVETALAGSPGGIQVSLAGGGRACTIDVSPGSDLDAVVAQASAGDVVCFEPGSYGHLNIVGKSGLEGSPIEFRSVGGEAIFELGGYEVGGGTAAVFIKDSSYIVVDGLSSTNSMKGVGIDSSSHVEALNCRAWDLGQEAIFVQGGSSHVRVAGCDVSETGNRAGNAAGRVESFNVWGELIYIGSGSSGGDQTNNVIVENNVLHDNGNATSEAINVKSETRDITIRENHIFNIDSWCEAAIRVNSSSNLVISGNIVHDITASGIGGNGAPCSDAIGIRFDSDSAIVENNVVFRANHTGIMADHGSGGVVRNNTLFANGVDFAARGSVETSGNLTSDGSDGRTVSSDAFVGPLNGSADAGLGPGTGFELVTGLAS